MSTSEKKPRQMPKGGRKGGSIFPRVPLADALGYAQKLVSKTHTGPATREVVLMGVIGSKYEKGEVGMSALKQYGLMSGDAKTKYSAEDLAKRIAAAPPEELIPLYRQAALKPTVFKSLFETYHSDTVSKAKLKQRASDLKVHPDETVRCVDLYVATMLTAELVTVEGDQVRHATSADAERPSATEDSDSGDAGEEGEPVSDQAQVADGTGEEDADKARHTNGASDESDRQGTGFGNRSGPRAVFNVNVNLDSSLDIEKLQKQLELLKKFGAI